MARAKFQPGQLVSVSPKPTHGFAPKGAYSFSPRGAYRIVRALPNAGGPPLYRVRSDSEAFERIVDESQIGIEE